MQDYLAEMKAEMKGCRMGDTMVFRRPARFSRRRLPLGIELLTSVYMQVESIDPLRIRPTAMERTYRNFITGEILLGRVRKIP